jgi:hypothetical protein
MFHDCAPQSCDSATARRPAGRSLGVLFLLHRIYTIRLQMPLRLRQRYLFFALRAKNKQQK